MMEFPKTPEEAATWKPTRRRAALACHVLVVAKTRIEGTWKAYIDAVPGINHDHEWKLVERVGATLSEGVARTLFPEFKDIPYAR